MSRVSSDPPIPPSGGSVGQVTDVMCAVEVAEVDLPHVVLTTASGSPSVTCSGPYSTGLQALAVAEMEHRAELAAGGSGEIRFHVAPLYPAVDLVYLHKPTATVVEPGAGADCG